MKKNNLSLGSITAAQRLELAQRPDSPDKLLADIVEYEQDYGPDKEVVGAVLVNPNASIDTLISALLNYSGDHNKILLNPALPMMAMVDPTYACFDDLKEILGTLWRGDVGALFKKKLGQDWGEWREQVDDWGYLGDADDSTLALYGLAHLADKLPNFRINPLQLGMLHRWATQSDMGIRADKDKCYRKLSGRLMPTKRRLVQAVKQWPETLFGEHTE